MTNKEPNKKRYRLSLVDDISHKRLWILHFTKRRIIVYSLLCAVLIFAGIFAVVALTPVKTLLPGYPDASTKLNATRDRILLDSLETQIKRWEFLTENIKKVLNGESPEIMDTSFFAKKDPSEKEILKSKDSALINFVDNEERATNYEKREKKSTIEGKHFFLPIKGVVSSPFKERIHPFIEISAPKNSMVTSVLDGTIVDTAWSDIDGYTIVIQHRDNIVSVYKKTFILLKQTGDFVKAGTPIAMTNDTESAKDKFLQFALWYKGKPENPENFIYF